MRVTLISGDQEKNFLMQTMGDLQEEIKAWCKLKRIKKCKFIIKGEAEVILPKENELCCLFG